MKRILIIFSLTFISSCGFIHYMGTKSAVDKSKLEVENYLVKNEIVFQDYSLFIKDELIDSLSIKKHAINLWQFEHGVEQSTIQLRIYDSLGNLINGYCQCYGDFKKLNILSEKFFKKFNHLPTNYDLKFKDNFSLWNISESEEREILKNANDKKFTLVVYWNIWSNYYSKEVLKKLKKYLRKFQMKNEALIILVNTDSSKVNR